MDLRHYQLQVKEKEVVARRNCEWLIGQFNPNEDRICCSICWNDTSLAYGKLVGEIIGAMLFSSGYWSSFTAKENPNKQQTTLRFKVERMNPEEYERNILQVLEAEDSDDEDDAPNKIDGPTAPVAQHHDEKTTT